MKKYELTIVFHPDLEMNLDPALDKIHQILQSANANIIKEENDGKKRLAYSIKGESYGIYYFMDLELPADGPNKISTTFNITDEVLRYLLVTADEHHDKADAKKEEAKTEEGKE